MVSVREFCARYDVSHQSVYKKISRNKNQLEGHIYKESCFMLDDYAENFLKPKAADSELFAECERIKAELSDKNAELDFLRDELSREKSKTEKLRSSLDNENLKTADFEKRLSEENLSGMNFNDVKKLPLADFTEMIIALVQKEDFKDFISVVSKLMK